MSVRRLGLGGLVFVLWVVLLGVVAFPALAAAPEVPKAEPPLEVRASTAVLYGVLDPGKSGGPFELGGYEFVYRQSATECEGVGEVRTLEGMSLGGGQEAVFQAIENLAANTQYSVCVVAYNEAKTEHAVSAPVTFTTALPPEVPVTEAGEKVTATTVTLRGEVDPGSTAKNGYYFAYSTSGECTAGGTSEPGTEETATERKVSTPVTGLEPLREYTACLVATNSAGEVAVGNAVKFSTPAAAPAIESELVSNVKAGEVRLEGVVNPNNEATECKFQYGTEPLLTTPTIVPCEPASFAGAFGGQGVGLSVGGLTSDTTYYYRVVATNGTGVNEGTIEHFTTAIPPEAPEALKAQPVTAATAMLHGVLNPGAERKSEPGTDEFRYRQSPTECEGEGEKAIAPPTTPVGEKQEAVSAEITGLLPGATYTFCLRAINAAGEEALSGPETFTTLAVGPTVSEEFVTNVSSESATLHGLVNPDGADTTYRFDYGPTIGYGSSVSGDAGAGAVAVLVTAHPQDLTPDTVYHYRLVAGNKVAGEVAGSDHTFTTPPAGATSALPDGRQWELVSPPDKHGAEVEDQLFFVGGLMQAADNGEAVTYITDAPIDGNALSNPVENQILSRRGPGGWSSQDIATPHAGASAREYRESFSRPEFVRLVAFGEYWAFSPDLSRAFVEPEATTPLAPPAPAPYLGKTADYDSGYVRDNGAGTYTITTLHAKAWSEEQVALSGPPASCDAGTSPAGGTVGQNGVDAVSQDGCYVYFNAAGGSGPLEVAHYDGTQWRTMLISSLAGAGALPWGSGGFTELSPDGRYLTFMSDERLTGYDNTDAGSPLGEPRADEEVFLYDAATNRLTCPSCDPTGERPVGQLDLSVVGKTSGSGKLEVDPTTGWGGHWLAGLLAPWPRNINAGSSLASDSVFVHQPRYLTDSGELFFESPLALVPQDVNGTWDVYEYRPQGVGGCAETAGCLALISSGKSRAESVLIEASTDGSDVFFFTSERLVAQDIDNVNDVYDAHVCSASAPCPPPPSPPPPACEGDACQQPAVPLIDPTPASLTYKGPGSVVAPAAVAKPRSKAKRCKPGFVRKKSKCVRAKTKRSRKTSRRGK